MGVTAVQPCREACWHCVSLHFCGRALEQLFRQQVQSLLLRGCRSKQRSHSPEVYNQLSQIFWVNCKYEPPSSSEMVLDMVSKQLKYLGKTKKCLLVPRQENHRMENFHLTLKNGKWLVLERQQVGEKRARGYLFPWLFCFSSVFFWGRCSRPALLFGALYMFSKQPPQFPTSCLVWHCYKYLPAFYQPRDTHAAD